MGGGRSTVPNAQLDSLQKTIRQINNGAVPQNFVPTASGHDPLRPIPKGTMPRSSLRNPQTEQFLDMLGLPYNLDQRQPQSLAVAAQGVTHLSICCIVLPSGAWNTSACMGRLFQLVCSKQYCAA